MRHRIQRLFIAAAVVGALTVSAALVHAQPDMEPINDLPNPYETIDGWAKLPAGRTWGSTSAVEIAPDGTVWVAERCGANTCLGSDLDPVLHFDKDGNLIRSFGSGLIASPHGIYVDREGNVWVTDWSDNAPRPERPANQEAARAAREANRSRMGPRPGATMGSQVHKFSPEGEVLMTLGTPGGAAEPGYFYQSTDVLVAPDGSIFVSDGHGGGNARVLKFTAGGELVKTFGHKGSADGEFNGAHALAMDSQGRLFVGDRSNNRIQIFDQEGNFLDVWYQFGRPSGVFIDANDMIYVADSESGSVAPDNGHWLRGIRIGSANDGTVTEFIPDPDVDARGTSAAEGVAVDPDGNIYGAEVGPRALKKYIRR
ncbi:MAG: peptidyl-alpha-hydroxyglycine alpha-amidating lyase family protein [Vicinamibacterales bacterium]|jgi:streptogramin lyase|nr:peptidyl-alpha-hydroxyglycine alpha-amidating lyase family protein [Vicinamibacterales bacterium]MDP6608871.1 peptidyl-alpha-hydroxyglycine alpha-amidating lyase family protein [Vicinamibacterales bacterium]|tara:strand:- start:140 stop:1249 length:1110 start_codon:yes stop_codon:yes gene_type:complete